MEILYKIISKYLERKRKFFGFKKNGDNLYSENSFKYIKEIENYFIGTKLFISRDEDTKEYLLSSNANNNKFFLKLMILILI